MGRIRIKQGNSEIELEGDDAFIDRQLISFYARFSVEAVKTSPKLIDDQPDFGKETDEEYIPSVAEYLLQKKGAETDGLSQLMLLANYLETYQKKSEFSAKNINDIADEAKLPKNIHAQYFSNAVKKGLLRNRSGGKYSRTLLAASCLTKKDIASANGSPITQSGSKARQKKQVIDGKVKAKTHVPSITLEKFDASGNKDRPSLEKFFASKNPGKDTGARIAVIGYYITKMLGQESFSEGQIDYAYRELELKGKPTFLRQIIVNNKNQKAIFEEAADRKNWVLSRKGEILVDEKLPSAKNG